jgi:hypothetical protein
MTMSNEKNKKNNMFLFNTSDNLKPTIDFLYNELTEDERKQFIDFTLWVITGVGVLTEEVAKAKTPEESIQIYKFGTSRFFNELYRGIVALGKSSATLKAVVYASLYDKGTAESTHQNAMNLIRKFSELNDSPKERNETRNI